MRLIATDHAIERWNDRVRPALGPKEAARDLIRSATNLGQISHTPPTWAPYTQKHPRQRFMLVGDDICLVLEPRRQFEFVIVTTLHRGGMSDNERQRRNRRAANRRGRRKTLRRDR